MHISLLPVLETNYLFLFHAPESGMTGVVDPALDGPVLEMLETRGWTLDVILNTHHHGDHVGGNRALKQATGCRIYGAAVDAARIPGIDTRVEDGEMLTLGGLEAQVLYVPGHTSGHIAYYFAKTGALFCGDTLFAMGCGRLFEGTAAQMYTSLERLAALPDNTRVYCAHEYTEANGRFALSVEPENTALQARMDAVQKLRAADRPTIPSTIGAEKATNPFFRPHSPEIRKTLGMADATDVEVFTELRRRKDRFG